MVQKYALFILLAVAIALPTISLHAEMPLKVEGETGRSYWQLLFLYERTEAPGQRDVIYRPILPVYGSYRNTEKAFRFRHFIYPLFYIKGTNYWSTWNSLELFKGNNFYHQDTKEDTDWFFPPFFHGGRGDAKDERYFGVFPFYGTFRNKLSWDRIHYVLFPLYADWSYGDYKARSILWPIVMWGGSPVRRDFRILFLYSRKKHTGHYRRTTFLWPFFQWGAVNLNKKEPVHYFFFFPFYGHKWSEHGRMSATTILWPLFSWGGDEERRSFSLNLFFFLYQYGRSEDPRIYKNIVFPFWGVYRYGSKDGAYYNDFFFYTPLYAGLDMNASILESHQRYYGMFLYQTMWTYWKQEREEERYYKMWPLYTYRKDSYGNMDFATLSLWFFRADTMDRIGAPVLSGQVMEYRRFENGDRYASAFLRIFARYWSDSQNNLFAAGFDYHRDPDGWMFQFLGGFLGYGRSREGDGVTKNDFRLLWLHL